MFSYRRKIQKQVSPFTVLRAIPWARLCIFAGKCHKKYSSRGPYYRRLINVSFFLTIYYAWISYAFKSYIDNYFTHYKERRWRLELQKTSLWLPLKMRDKQKKEEKNIFPPKRYPFRWWQIPRFYPYNAPNLREYKQMKEV